MKVAVTSGRPYDRDFLTSANEAVGSPHQLKFIDARLDAATDALSRGADVIRPFVNDQLDKEVLRALADQGTTLVALRGRASTMSTLPQRKAAASL